MRRTPFLMIGSLFLLLAACGGDPAATIELREVPGDIDGRVVINPDDFELSYSFACEPLNCVTECSIQEGDWFKCESPYVLTEDSEEHEISEGVLRFSVRSVHDDEKSSAKHADLLVLYEFDFDIEPVHGLDTGGGDFYYEDEYQATCSRSDCEISCQWRTESSLVDQPCSLKDPFEVELPAGVEEASLVIEACAKNFGGKADDEHCAEPREYKFYQAPPGWIALSVGDGHSCGILEDKSLWCWGANNAGQLGIDDPRSVVEVPTRVSVEEWRAVAAGEEHTCGIQGEGKLYCWGEVENQRLGLENPENARKPVLVDAGSWVAISAGGAHTCGVKANGDLACWGLNTYGQIGNGESGNVEGMSILARPEVGKSWLKVSVGKEHSCALGETSDGPRAFCWGRARDGRLGNNEDSGNQTTPQPVRGGPEYDDTDHISAGERHSCASAVGNNIRRTYCWGAGASGRLGTGGIGNVKNPERVEQGEDYFMISAGQDHTCAVKEGGEAFCWGDNRQSQLGIEDDKQEVTIPVAIAMPHGLGLKWVEAGSDFTCAIATNDRIYCWGASEQGRLGIKGASGLVSVPGMISWPQGEFVPDEPVVEEEDDEEDEEDEDDD